MNKEKESFQTTGLKMTKQAGLLERIILPIMIVLNTILFVIMAFFNAAASTPLIKGLFKNKTNEISNVAEVSITPAGWTFSTWGIIYAWQILWLIFNIVLIFIKDKNGQPLFRSPVVLSPLFHLFITFNFVLNIVWLFIWDNQDFTGAFIGIFFMTAVLYVAIVISHKNVYDAQNELSSTKWVIWLYRIFANNGLAFYATWISVATIINLAIAITYKWTDAKDRTYWISTSGVIGLSILAILLIAYFLMDIYFFEKYLRYTFSPYIQLAIALGGILSKNWSSQSPAAIFALCLIIIGPGIMLITKIISTVYKSITQRNFNN
jgi:hypothetical protein